MKCRQCGTDITHTPLMTLTDGVCYKCSPRKDVAVNERVSLDGEQAAEPSAPTVSVQKELRG